MPKLFADPPYTQIPCEIGGINNRGQSVGYSETKTGERHAVLWQHGQIMDLGGFAGGDICEATAINDRGQIVGSATTQGYNIRRALLWQNGKRYNLGTLKGDTDSLATAINAAGVVVGWSLRVLKFRPPSRAFLWRNGRMFDLIALLPPHSGWRLDAATGINEKGQIVGTGLHYGKRRGYLLTPKS